ncbi:MAG: PhzF family phenazine biosynthesis protein [Pirellulaceae bacterium]
MKAYDLWIVDSFTDRAFRGNPAGVYRSSELPNETMMQNLAFELNLSETAFLCSANGRQEPGFESAAYDIRFFSPKKEIPLCGHATLASAKVVFEHSDARQVTFQTASGLQVPVRRMGDEIEMRFPVYELEDAEAPQSLLSALDVSKTIYTGFNLETQILMIEIESAERLRELSPNSSALLDSCDSINGHRLHGVSVTAQADDEFDFHSRFFWPWSGGDEDPVTGGTHTFLAKYWAEKLGKKSLRSFQSSPRTGQMEVELASDESLYIRGKAIVILDAKLREELS